MEEYKFTSRTSIKEQTYIIGLEELKRDLELTKSIDKKIDLLKTIYQYIRETTEVFIRGENTISDNYKRYLALLWTAEKQLSKEYIIDFSIERPKASKKKDIEGTLKYIVDRTRAYLLSMANDPTIAPKDFEYAGECKDSAKFVQQVCEKLNIQSEIKCIECAFQPKSKAFDEGRYHYFNIVRIDGASFIVDVTYPQFFTINSNLFDRNGILLFDTTNPGAYMCANPQRKTVAKKILENGWIELNGETFKDYLDGFTLSFRNGLYYQETGDYSYETPYSFNDYIELIETDRTLLDCEKKEYLGFQMRPLRNGHWNQSNYSKNDK